MADAPQVEWLLRCAAATRAEGELLSTAVDRLLQSAVPEGAAKAFQPVGGDSGREWPRISSSRGSGGQQLRLSSSSTADGQGAAPRISRASSSAAFAHSGEAPLPDRRDALLRELHGASRGAFLAAEGSRLVRLFYMLQPGFAPAKVTSDAQFNECVDATPFPLSGCARQAPAPTAPAAALPRTHHGVT